MEKKDDYVKVSDWSQKYKLVIYAASGIAMTFIGYRLITLLELIAINTIVSVRDDVRGGGRW